jgi:hypothetical protein
MNAETITIRIVGTRPLLIHSGRLADPLDPITQDLARVTAKRPRTTADLEEISRREWHGSLWLDHERPCIPPEALEASFTEAARTRRRGRQARAGFLVTEPALLEYPGPQTVEQLWQDDRFRLRHAVRIGQARMMRTRPRFSRWTAEFNATFLTSLLSRTEILEFFAIAGFSIGIGDWRPKYGRFEVMQ